MFTDVFGLSITASNSEAVIEFNEAINSYFRFLRDTLIRLDNAIKLDPDMPMALCLRGVLQLLATKREVGVLAVESIQLAELALKRVGGSDRERNHLLALKLLKQENILAAVQIWEKILLDNPTDGLALKLAHYFYFMLGDPTSIRDSVARVIPAWEKSHKYYGHVLGIYAFGLQETGDYRGGEFYAREGFSMNPDDIYSVHSLTHVHEMEGRYVEGMHWLESSAKRWEHCNNFRFHTWWHYCNFCIELGNYDACLNTLDLNVRPDNSSDDFRDTSSAASVLWRLEFENIDVGNRWVELADIAERRMDEHIMAYADNFCMLALVGDGRFGSAQQHLKSLKDLRLNKEAIQSDVRIGVGIPICEALIAYKTNDFEKVVSLMMPVRYDISRLGGSHVQRDVFIQTFLQSVVKSSQKGLARALLSERIALKPNSSITWKLYAEALEGVGDMTGSKNARDKARLLISA